MTHRVVGQLDLVRVMVAGGVTTLLSSRRRSKDESGAAISTKRRCERCWGESTFIRPGSSFSDQTYAFSSFVSASSSSSSSSSPFALSSSAAQTTVNQATVTSEPQSVKDDINLTTIFRRWTTKAGRSSTKPSTREYDFIVIGNGNAGQSATKTLRKQCPTARIALIDPLRHHDKEEDDGSYLVFFSDRVTFLDPQARKVELPKYDLTIRYKHGVLIATGARGAPPPHYLMDEQARDLILELKATVLPRLRQERPILAPEQGRRRALLAASKGQQVALLGSGWEAIDLVTATAAVSRRGARPILVFGSSGPLSHVLPAYLSTAVAKRLRRSKQIDVQDRSLVRYVAHDDRGSRHRLQLYTVKAFDYLDTHMDMVDLLVLVPEVSGARGSAALATKDIPPHLYGSSKGRSWYQTWSSLSMPSISSPSMIACYKDDGRIAVNAELCACTGVYAAGPVAKYANVLSGHADVTGVGVVDEVMAGEIAATNMSRHYLATTGGPFGGFGSETPSMQVLTKDPIPVFRSDVLTSSREKSSLATIGINALCVGNCDSERFFTHGIWWTNQAAQRRLMQLLDDDNSKSIRRRRSIRQRLKPVYGLGIIYYLDRTGKIQGIMTWGLPFTTRQKSVEQQQQQQQQLNGDLVQHMKHMIRTNGGFGGSLQSEADHIRMSKYLTAQSRHLMELSLAGYMMGEDTVVEDFEKLPRPLHRFTEVRPPSVRSVGVLKRKGGHAHGILGEDLFASYETILEDTPIAKPDLQHPGNDAIAAKAKSMYEWNVWEQKEKRWEENEQRARPPKEEPLWLRKGDELRNTSAKDNLLSAYNTAIWSKS